MGGSGDDHDAASFPREADIDAVLAEFGGDARAAIRALLVDIDALARDYARDVSVGYVRGEGPWRNRHAQ